MSKSNPNQSQNSNLKPRKKNDPRYERVIVGHRMVAMQASHVDEIALAEARARGAEYQPAPGVRCPRCFLKSMRPQHFCRWDIAAEGPRDPSPPMLRVPVYRWVLRGTRAS